MILVINTLDKAPFIVLFFLISSLSIGNWTIWKLTECVMLPAMRKYILGYRLRFKGNYLNRAPPIVSVLSRSCCTLPLKLSVYIMSVISHVNEVVF